MDHPTHICGKVSVVQWRCCVMDTVGWAGPWETPREAFMLPPRVLYKSLCVWRLIPYFYYLLHGMTCHCKDIFMYANFYRQTLKRKRNFYALDVKMTSFSAPIDHKHFVKMTTLWIQWICTSRKLCVSGSSNGPLLGATKPLAEPILMLTYPCWGTVAFTSRKFHRK